METQEEYMCALQCNSRPSLHKYSNSTMAYHNPQQSQSCAEDFKTLTKNIPSE